MTATEDRALGATMFLLSLGLVLFELALTRVFGVVLFASFAHLALGVAMLGISLGALAQHVRPEWVPAEGLERRLAGIALAQGGLSVLAALAALVLPVTLQSNDSPEHYGERSAVAWSLISPLWFGVLLPLLASPFAAAGLAFGGAFHRRREQIGRLYALDLAGGGAAALLFLPLLALVPAPDLVWVVLAACAGAAWGLTRRAGGALPRLALALTLLGAGLAGASAARGGLLQVRAAAGYSEENITWSRWTPLTRIAVHESTRGTFAVLDNTSASQIVRTEGEVRRLAREPNRALVYRLKPPGARVAILAASAGPEVAVARHHGHEDIDAIDIAAVPDMVRARFPDDPVNPFRGERVRRVVADGRSAILHATEPYDIIQMVHANLHSAAGLLASAWSPSLLESREAFDTYLDHLAPGGILSFGRGARTPRLAHAAAAALRARGVERPELHILTIRGAASLMLVRDEPWTAAQRDEVRTLLARDYPDQTIHLDPIERDRKQIRRVLEEGAPITDDRPYMESPEDVAEMLGQAAQRLLGRAEGEVDPGAIVYHTLLMQAVFTALGGLALMAVAALSRERVGLGSTRGLVGGLGYAAGLGYGYLAVETALIHELVLFVGHPTYALTAVIFTMMLSSGVGSALAQRVPLERGVRVLRGALLATLALGALQAFVLPELLHATALGLPLGVRVLLTGAALAPLGLVMGVPWSLGMRLLRPEAGGLVPWAWAVNGWMSVVASLSTVLLSRVWGYNLAFAVALGAYVLALALAGRLPRVGAPR